MSDDYEGEPYLSPEARKELALAMKRPPPEDSELVKLLKEMIASGHAMEAAEYAKLLAYTEALDARAALLVLSDAILNPEKLKRKRGDKFTSRVTLEKLTRERAIAQKVQAARDATKARSRGGRKKHVENALEKIGTDPKLGTSIGTAKRAYYKHKA